MRSQNVAAKRVSIRPGSALEGDSVAAPRWAASPLARILEIFPKIAPKRADPKAPVDGFFAKVLVNAPDFAVRDDRPRTMSQVGTFP